MATVIRNGFHFGERNRTIGYKSNNILLRVKQYRVAAKLSANAIAIPAIATAIYLRAVDTSTVIEILSPYNRNVAISQKTASSDFYFLRKTEILLSN